MRPTAPGMAAVVVEAARSIAPLVSLYVNDFNTPARAAYRRVGFTETGRLMSVLFSPGGITPRNPPQPAVLLAVIPRGPGGPAAPRGSRDVASLRPPGRSLQR